MQICCCSFNISKFSFLIQGSANLVRDASCWKLEHEWRQDIAVVTKWLSGVSPVGGFLVFFFCLWLNINFFLWHNISVFQIVVLLLISNNMLICIIINLPCFSSLEPGQLYC